MELIGWKLGAALAAGCTLVVKPSEWTPLSAVALLDRVIEAEFQAGVVNLMHGAGPWAPHSCRIPTSTRSRPPVRLT